MEIDGILGGPMEWGTWSLPTASMHCYQSSRLHSHVASPKNNRVFFTLACVAKAAYRIITLPMKDILEHLLPSVHYCTAAPHYLVTGMFWNSIVSVLVWNRGHSTVPALVVIPPILHHDTTFTCKLMLVPIKYYGVWYWYSYCWQNCTLQHWYFLIAQKR